MFRKTRLLTDSEFHETFSKEMIQQDSDGMAPFRFWKYVDRIPAEHFQGFDCSAGSVKNVYRDSDGRFEHVLIDSDHPNVFMAIVLDLKSKKVYGHHLLNLVAKYGLEEVENPN
jgi:hypothetical protein